MRVMSDYVIIADRRAVIASLRAHYPLREPAHTRFDPGQDRSGLGRRLRPSETAFLLNGAKVRKKKCTARGAVSSPGAPTVPSQLRSSHVGRTPPNSVPVPVLVPRTAAVPSCFFLRHRCLGTDGEKAHSTHTHVRLRVRPSTRGRRRGCRHANTTRVARANAGPLCPGRCGRLITHTSWTAPRG